MRKPLIIGHSYNPKAINPKEALDPTIPNSAGWRLWQMSCIDMDTYLKTFTRLNTSPGGPLKPALMRERAAALVSSGMFKNRRVLIVGAENARMYPWPRRMPPRMTWYSWREHNAWVMWIPHTSGLVMFWNETANRHALRVRMEELAGEGVLGLWT